MNAHSITRDGIIAALTPRRPVNIAPVVQEFANQSQHRLDALGRACRAISNSVASGNRYVHQITGPDFEELRRFIEFSRGDFALSNFTVRDTATDQQHTPDESHFLDRERL